MPVKTYKPTSPGRRGMSVSTFEEITKTRPERALTEPLKKTAGRNTNGRITTRHRGGGHKRLYRIIDWKRNKIGVRGQVIAIEYDPNRSARIALIQYEDGERRYILAPVGVRVGTRLSSGPEADLAAGNALVVAASVLEEHVRPLGFQDAADLTQRRDRVPDAAEGQRRHHAIEPVIGKR